MPRLDYVDEGGAVEVAIRERRGGTLTPLDRLLLHSPALAAGWNQLLGAVRSDTTLPAATTELAILRIAHLNGAAYEWAAHEPHGRSAGLTAPQLEAIRGVGSMEQLSVAQRAVVAYVDAMTRDIEVSDEVFRAVHDSLDQRAMLELTVTIGAYNLVSRFLVALDVQPSDRQAAR